MKLLFKSLSALGLLAVVSRAQDAAAASAD